MLNRIYTFIDTLVHSDKRSVEKHTNRRCPVTSLDISMQPGHSKFLSYTGVKWYYANVQETYQKILEPRLPISWKDQSQDKQFREIAHAIRNSDSNPRNNTRKILNKLLQEKNTLFDNISLIDKRKLKEAGLQ